MVNIHSLYEVLLLIVLLEKIIQPQDPLHVFSLSYSRRKVREFDSLPGGESIQRPCRFFLTCLKNHTTHQKKNHTRVPFKGTLTATSPREMFQISLFFPFRSPGPRMDAYCTQATAVPLNSCPTNSRFQSWARFCLTRSWLSNAINTDDTVIKRRFNCCFWLIGTAFDPFLWRSLGTRLNRSIFSSF